MVFDSIYKNIFSQLKSHFHYELSILLYLISKTTCDNSISTKVYYCVPIQHKLSKFKKVSQYSRAKKMCLTWTVYITLNKISLIFKDAISEGKKLSIFLN